MIKTALVTAMLSLSALSANAAELITKSSPHNVAMTMDKLVAAVEKAGATIFARVDHAAGAKKIGADLKPNQILVFGNPKLGTPIMQQNPAAGLDLPIRVVVYTSADGSTMVAYHNPSRISEDHKINADLKALKMMAGALNNLSGAAIAK